jgi:hypothetical protein
MIKFDLKMRSTSIVTSFFQVLFGGVWYWHTQNVELSIWATILTSMFIFALSFSRFLSGAYNAVEVFDVFAALVAPVAVLALLHQQIIAGFLLVVMALVVLLTCSIRLCNKKERSRGFLLVNTLVNLPLGVGTIIGVIILVRRLFVKRQLKTI